MQQSFSVGGSDSDRASISFITGAVLELICRKSVEGLMRPPITRWDQPNAQLPPQCAQGNSSSVMELLEVSVFDLEL
jgi:hypothetical protein